MLRVDLGGWLIVLKSLSGRLSPKHRSQLRNFKIDQVT